MFPSDKMAVVGEARGSVEPVLCGASGPLRDVKFQTAGCSGPRHGPQTYPRNSHIYLKRLLCLWA